MLIATATNSQENFNKIVAETFTMEEYFEWLKVQQKFQSKQTLKNERELSCIIQNKHAKSCIDSHWCLYPTNIDKDECVWYKIKYNL